MMITPEQIEAVKNGETVQFSLDETEVLLVRKDRVGSLVFDDGSWTDEEMLFLAEQTFADADTAGPIS